MSGNLSLRRIESRPRLRSNRGEKRRPDTKLAETIKRPVSFRPNFDASLAIASRSSLIFGEKRYLVISQLSNEIHFQIIKSCGKLSSGGFPFVWPLSALFDPKLGGKTTSKDRESSAVHTLHSLPRDSLVERERERESSQNLARSFSS